MQAILANVLKYSIETNNISVVNSDDGSVYLIPYDGAFFDDILVSSPQLLVEILEDEDYDTDDFRLVCQFSHIGPDNQFYAQYQLRLGNIVLATETAPMVAKGKTKSNSLLRAAKKCARKIITQESQALKQGMLKTLRTGFEYES